MKALYIKRDFSEEGVVGKILDYMHRLPDDSDERQSFERVVVEVKSEEEAAGDGETGAVEEPSRPLLLVGR